LSTNSLDPVSSGIRVLPDHNTSVPALVLGGLEARSEARCRHEATAGLVGGDGRFADNELVSGHAGSNDLEESRVWPCACGVIEEAVAGGVLIRVLVAKLFC